MKVIAIERGFDNLTIREPGGDPFDMPDNSFEARPVIDPVTGRETGRFHELPAWFVPFDEDQRKDVEKEKERIARANTGVSRGVPAIDPRVQQADAEREARKLAAAQENERLKKQADEQEAARKKVEEARAAEERKQPKK